VIVNKLEDEEMSFRIASNYYQLKALGQSHVRLVSTTKFIDFVNNPVKLYLHSKSK
jgi:hypothetical protein